MNVRHSLIGGFGVMLLAILSVVLLASVMMSRLESQWSEMSTVVNKRHHLMMTGSLHLGYATLHFTNLVRDGGNDADRFLQELNSVGDAVAAYRSTGSLSQEEQMLLDKASSYIGLYRADLRHVLELRAAKTDTTDLRFQVQSENDKLLAMVIRKLTDLTNSRTDRAAEEISRQIRANRTGLLLAALIAAAAVIATGILAARAIIRHEAGRNRAMRSLEIEITEHERAEEMIHIQAAELEQEVAERQMAQESLQEQAQELEAETEKLQQTQEELERLNEELEQRVRERTAELSEKNDEIQRAYDDLKRIQAQLLHQDKMASIGQLAAGVAHEINNPMGFIISNLGSLGKYVEKLAAFLDANERHLAGSEPAVAELVVQERKKYKIDHIRKDLPDLISESLEGAERVRKIVQDLKGFSRIDSSADDPNDINEGLERTLSIAWNELKYKATVTKDYGELPLVRCNLGQMNQVFLNILVNAAHAIEERGVIRIATWAEAGVVKIAISDTGGGIPAGNAEHIFEPFFTTKEVGKGTGLGLSIAYDIVVNKHGGQIEVESEMDTGSTFTITLPVQGTADSQSV